MTQTDTTEAALQDIGHEFGCPPGIRITQWLSIRLRQADRVDEAAREVVLNYMCGEPNDRSFDELRKALGIEVSPI